MRQSRKPSTKDIRETADRPTERTAATANAKRIRLSLVSKAERDKYRVPVYDYIL